MRLLFCWTICISVAMAAHGQPFLLKPEYRATFVPVEGGELVWKPVSGATRYDVTLIATPTTKVLDRVSTADTLLDMPVLDEFRTYNWYVEYFREDDYGGMSAIWGFTTESFAPGTPTLTAPEDGAALGVYILADSTDVTLPLEAPRGSNCGWTANHRRSQIRIWNSSLHRFDFCGFSGRRSGAPMRFLLV